MTIQDMPQVMTTEDFEQFVNLPENAEKHFEFVAGEIVEVPSNPFVSKIASMISGFIFMYLLKNDIGHVTGEAGGYMVGTERYAPDVAFISYDKQPELAKSGYNPNPPDLAIEVVSADSKSEQERLTIKLSHYLAVGTEVWIVRPESQWIEIHRSNLAPQQFSRTDTLTMDRILPGFTLELSAIFKQDAPADTEKSADSE
ncbi:MAG: Uma2 family endonuclease [Chloroflexota bacterium]